MRSRRGEMAQRHKVSGVRTYRNLIFWQKGRTLAKIAKNAKRSGYARTRVNGGGTFLSPTKSFERGTGMSPLRSLSAHLRELCEFTSQKNYLAITPTALNSKAQRRVAHAGSPIPHTTEPQRGSTRGAPQRAFLPLFAFLCDLGESPFLFP